MGDMFKMKNDSYMISERKITYVMKIEEGIESTWRK